MNDLSSMPSWLKIATFFLLASLLTLWLKKPTVFWYNTNINDFFLMVSMFFFSGSIIKREVALPRLIRSFLIGAGLILGTLLLGTLLSYVSYHTVAPDALREYVRAISAGFIFFELLIIGFSYKKIIPTILGILAIPSIIIPILLYLPISSIQFFLDDSHSRFMGFLYDPNYFATLHLLPTFILLWICFTQPFGKKLWISITSLALFSCSVAAIIWSGSRGGIAGLCVGLGILCVLILLKTPFKKSLLMMSLIIIATASSYVVLPRHGQLNVMHRIDVITETGSPQVLTNATTIAAPTPVPLVSKFAARQGRFPIWKSAFEYIIKNPFGYGPGYGNTIDIVGADNDHHRVAHNTLLQILLTGGWLLLGILGFGGIMVTRNVLISKTPFGVLEYLYACLISILTAALFLDSLWSRWIWIIIALMIVIYHHTHEPNH